MSVHLSYPSVERVHQRNTTDQMLYEWWITDTNIVVCVHGAVMSVLTIEALQDSTNSIYPANKCLVIQSWERKKLHK